MTAVVSEAWSAGALRRWGPWAVVPAASALYQVTAKLAADALAHGAGPAALTAHAPLLAAVVVCDLVCFVAWLLVLETTSLAAAFPLSAASYVAVITAGAVLFREPLHPAALAGSLLILVGVRLLAGRRAG